MTNVRCGNLARPVLATFVLAVAAAAQAAGPWAVKLQKTVVDPTFRSEGVAVGDVNHDGKPDLLVGDLWYEAPNWRPHEIRPVGKYVAARGYSKCFECFAQDVNGDGWVDEVVVVFPGKPGYWYENPKNKPGHWKEREVAPDISNETPLQVDLLGDGGKVLVFGCKGAMVWAVPNADANKPFGLHKIAAGPNAPGTKRFSHGLGVGDINSDGRNDVLINTGWWEAPKDRTKEGWTFHKADLGPDCANMLVYDIDGDGDSDVISSSAHKYGIWWFEQKPGKSGEPIFVQHEIDKSWSQSHAAELADMNGDGLMDLVIGKRHLAHNGGDPDSKGPAVMYWYELRRPAKGKVEFIPHKFDDASGVGTQFAVADMNGDGKPDVITSNKSGVHVFLQAGGERAEATERFDGKSLVGWEGDENFFRVEDGAIVGGSMERKVAHNAKIDRRGVIGLEIHGGGPSEAWYKDIRITALS